LCALRLDFSDAFSLSVATQPNVYRLCFSVALASTTVDFVASLINCRLTVNLAVADLEGAEPPPPLGDGLTPSLTVMLANVKF